MLLGSTLQYWHKLPDTFEKSEIYGKKVHISFTTRRSFVLSACALFILVIQQ